MSKSVLREEEKKIAKQKQKQTQTKPGMFTCRNKMDKNEQFIEI